MPSLAVPIPPSSATLIAEFACLPTTSDSLRCESQTIISDAPMTPPLSPRHSPFGLEAIIVDSEPRCGGLQRNNPCPLPDTITLQPDEMEVDRPKEATASHAPLRVLEDEKVHLQKSGLRLSDFDVRGTLGFYLIFA